MPKAPSGFESMSELHLRQLARLAERGAVRRLKRIYDQAQGDLERKIAQFAGRPSAPFTPVHLARTLAQVRQGQAVIGNLMAEALGETSRETQIDALRQLVTRVKKMERKFGGTTPIPIEEAARFAGVIDRNTSVLRKMHRGSMGRYSVGVVRKTEQALAQSLIQQESMGDAIDRIQSVTGGEWWQAERVIRTEQSYAYSRVQADAVAESKAEMPDLMMRWTEHVDDETYRPMDSRVGADSIALHGQVAEPGASFVVPPTTPGGKAVPPSLSGKTFSHPPSRPNDRAVLQPWRPNWGIPGWVWRGGRRVYLHKR